MTALRELSAEQLDALADDQLIEIVLNEIKSGGPDREEEHVRLAPWAENQIRALHKEWRAKPKPMVWINGRPYPAHVWEAHQRKLAAQKAGQSFILPAPQPTATEERKDTPRKAIVAKYIEAHRDDLAAAAAPKRKPDEEEPEEEPAQEPGDEEQEAAQTKPLEEKIVASTQIALPITATAAKAVALLNRKHHVIGNYGNRCVVLSWELWEIDRDVMIPTFQRFDDFSKRYMNRYVWKQTKNGLDKVPAGTFWLKDPGRLTYDSVTFRPKALEFSQATVSTSGVGSALKNARAVGS